MRLLLAEDERSLSRALAAILKRDGYAVDCAYDGEQALSLLSTGNYDGVILDIMMPKRDGIEVLKQLRDKGDRTPVLLLTAKSEIDDKVLGLDSGANDYLTKPFATRELLARVRAMTRGQAVSTDSILRFGNISLDRTTFSLSSPTGSFRLANKEFAMLELLLCNAQHAITSRRFLERVWDDDAETEVVLIYISYLQKTLSALQADERMQAAEPDSYRLESCR
ncbi:MAG: response regulator transcription factor [Butyricicoccus sp.]|nr:response regulator transcription factor [Butyricicoccus sp.]